MNSQEIFEKLDRFAMPTYARQKLALVRGEGTRVWDAEGREYLDFLSGLGVNNLGHCHEAVVHAVRKQAAQLLHVSNLYYIAPQAELAQLLSENSFGGQCFFCNSGTEANEAAFKLARKFWREKGQDRFEIIAANRSFHGRTLASLSATGQPKYHQGFEPLAPGFLFVDFNDAAALRDAISDKTAAVILEPIQIEGGIYSAADEYLKQVRQICDETGVLLILDEVQTGMGRTGTLFAYEQYGIQPDIMTLAKALAGGIPIGAVVAKKEVAQVFGPGTHAATFGGNPLACSAGIAVVKEMTRPGFFENVTELSARFFEQLEEIKGKHTVIQEIRGKGLIIGLQLEAEVGNVLTPLLEDGIIAGSAGPNTLRFAPPLIVETAEIDRAVGSLDRVLSQMGATVK